MQHKVNPEVNLDSFASKFLKFSQAVSKYAEDNMQYLCGLEC